MNTQNTQNRQNTEKWLSRKTDSIFKLALSTTYFVE